MTTASPTLQGAVNDGLGEAIVACDLPEIKNGLGEAVLACDMPEPCKFPSLDSCHKWLSVYA